MKPNGVVPVVLIEPLLEEFPNVIIAGPFVAEMFATAPDEIFQLPKIVVFLNILNSCEPCCKILKNIVALEAPLKSWNPPSVRLKVIVPLFAVQLPLLVILDPV